MKTGWKIEGKMVVEVTFRIERIRWWRFQPSWKHKRLFAPPEVTLFVPSNSVSNSLISAGTGDVISLIDNLDIKNDPRLPWLGISASDRALPSADVVCDL